MTTRKKQKKMTKNVLYLIIILVVLSCQSKKYSKENLIYTKEITTGLFIEKYKTYAGSATTSDSYSYYITDSAHFRKLIGEKYYDDESIIWYISDDIITVYKKKRIYHFETNVNKTNSVIESDMKIDEILPNSTITYDSTLIGRYKIEELVKEAKFE